MRKSAVFLGLLVAVQLAYAAPATRGRPATPESDATTARLTAIDLASRQLIADGTTWALSSTVRVKVPGQKGGSLRDLHAGMNVRLLLAPTAGELPVVSHITVLPD